MIKNFEQFLNETKNSKLLCDFGCCYIGEFLKKNPDFNETEFTEYVGAHNKADRDSGELNDICKE